MKKRKQRVLPQPCTSQTRIVTVLPDKVGLFRFILEAHDNIALFTVLDRHAAHLKLLFSPHQARAVDAMLQSMRPMLEVLDVVDYHVPTSLLMPDASTSNTSGSSNTSGIACSSDISGSSNTSGIACSSDISGTRS